MVGVTRYRAGDVAVEVDDGLEQLARRAAEEVAPGVLGRLEPRVVGVLDEAVEEWPVKTGESSRGLHVQTDFSDDEVAVAIGGTAAHTELVRPAAWYGSETAWSRLVQKPMADLAEDEVERVIDAAVREGLGGD